MSDMCNMICGKYRALGSSGNGRYVNGQKRCNSCEIFMYWDGLRCPCCGCSLRSNPRNAKARKKLRSIILVSQQ